MKKVSDMIDSIQAMRGIAALMVVTMHVATDIKFNFSSDIWIEIYHVASSYGHAGVDMFFVISGVIMYQITRSGQYNNSLLEACDYLFRRAFRIYPLLWITLLFIIVSKGINYEPVMRDLFLIRYPEIHAVAWSLPFEVRFYAVVAVLILFFRRRLDLALAGWVVLETIIIAANALKYPLVSDVYFNNTMMFEFCFGLGVGALTTRRINFYPLLVGIVGFIYFLYGCSVIYGDMHLVGPQREVLYGIPAAMLLYSVITLEGQGRLKVSGVLHWLGDISYSLYLWHLPILHFFVARISPGGDPVWNGVQLGVTVLTITFIVSSLSYWLLEQPIMKLARGLAKVLWGKYRVKRAAPAPAPDVAVSPVAAPVVAS